MLLLIAEAKCKFVFRGKRRTVWMRNSKTSYSKNEYSLPNNCVKRNVVEECNTNCS